MGAACLTVGNRLCGLLAGDPLRRRVLDDQVPRMSLFQAGQLTASFVAASLPAISGRSWT